MFKVGKIKQVKNEKVKIKKVEYEHGKFVDGKGIYDKVETLAFKINAEDYSFEFTLKCPLDKLLELPMNESVDLEKYLFSGETIFNANGEKGCIDPEMNIKIYRYLDDRYEISLYFYTEGSNEEVDYTGLIRFDFDLNDYLDKK